MSIQRLMKRCAVKLPDAYLDFLRRNDGGEGTLAVEPGWFRLWATEEIVENNEAYEVTTHLSSYFGFGTGGGGELLAFKVTDAEPWAVYMIPFITLSEEDAVIIAESFRSFVEAVGRE